MAIKVLDKKILKDNLDEILEEVKDKGADLIVVQSELGMSQNIEIARSLKDISGGRVAPDPWPYQSRPEVSVDVRFEDLLPTAMAVAQEIAEKAPLAMKYAKQTANMVEEMPQRDAYRMEQNFTMALSKSEDALEARMSFLEKRKPVFKGR